MSKEYKLTLFEKGDFKDNFGNFWCDAAFENEKGEIEDHVKWVVKDPTVIKVGESYYGHFETKESKAGKNYLRFYREQRPEGEYHVDTSTSNGSSNNTHTAKKDWQPRDDNAIRAQWAIGQAVQLLTKADKTFTEDACELYAKRFYAMVERVKDSEPVETTGTTTVEAAVAQAQAKRDQDIISSQRSGVPVPDEVYDPNGEEVSLSDIPF